jgi:hypothetical protein
LRRTHPPAQEAVSLRRKNMLSRRFPNKFLGSSRLRNTVTRAVTQVTALLRLNCYYYSRYKVKSQEVNCIFVVFYYIIETNHNYSAGLHIFYADRKKMIQECKNPITEGDLKWIFACNCEGTEQLPQI